MRWSLLQISKQRHFMCKTCTDSFFSSLVSRLHVNANIEHWINSPSVFVRVLFAAAISLLWPHAGFFFLTFLCESIAFMFTFNSTFLHALYDFSTTKNVCKGFWFFSLLYFYTFLLWMIFLQRRISIEREYVKQLNK